MVKFITKSVLIAILALWSVNISAQGLDRGCVSETGVSVAFTGVYAPTFFPSYFSVEVTWTVGNPSWVFTDVQTVLLTSPQQFDMQFFIPACEEEIGSITIKVYKGNLLGVSTIPRLLTTYYVAGYFEGIGLII
jgi:hypothetical protein